MASDSDEVYQSVPRDLPPRLLALDCYPSHPVRINSYSKAKYLIDIFNILYGTPELQLLLQSPLGSLFSLPVRYCSLSGQLLHQLLCRQLFTEEIDATWFVFAGQPLRFSLKEFEEITSLCCSEYPSAAEVRFSTSYADGGDATFPPLPRPKKRRLTDRSGERGKKKKTTRRQSKQSTAGLFRISKSSIIDDVCRVHQSSTHDAVSSSTSTSIDEKHISPLQGHLSQPPTPALSEASVGGTSAVPPLANPVNRDASVTKSEPFILSAEADDTCVTSALVTPAVDSSCTQVCVLPPIGSSSSQTTPPDRHKMTLRNKNSLHPLAGTPFPSSKQTNPGRPIPLLSTVAASLTAPDQKKVAKLKAQLAKAKTSEYMILGQPVRPSFFTEILQPQQWLSTPHIDVLLAFIWGKHETFFRQQRITILDSLFTSIIASSYATFNRCANPLDFVWHRLLILSITGSLPGRQPPQRWLEDVDTVYIPMNWGRKHWVTLSLDLRVGHISILDPFPDCNSARKVLSYMSPVAKTLPDLVRSVFGKSPSQWPESGFTFARLEGLAQNKRGGDCGAICVKFLELHSHALQDQLIALTDAEVNNLRCNYALALYEEFVGKL
ncbi:hypothetical protein AXX17_ATUG00040 [Arabidopsis thaliana]|uniref:Ubiquitin-like protease family profile domain-containing protein n=1 Tax=Arabidopsis thaliana TaxID=3702 RepID=A0A178U8N8_ARATH|nr:hypothetical protein AXX17_ATUG00040 [Arabidopsis thaliana]